MKIVIVVCKLLVETNILHTLNDMTLVWIINIYKSHFAWYPIKSVCIFEQFGIIYTANDDSYEFCNISQASFVEIACFWKRSMWDVYFTHYFIDDSD